MDKKKLWNITKIVLKVGVTALLIYLVLDNIDISKVKDRFLNSDPLYVSLALILYITSLFVGCWRNLSFLKSIGLNLKFGFNFRLYLLGLFYNAALPGGVGGDGYKIYILRKKYQLPTKRIFLAMLFDRLSGLWAIGVIAVALIIFIPKIDIPAEWPVIGLIAGTVVYYLVQRRFFKDYSRVFFETHSKAILVQSLQTFTIICLLLSQDFNGKFSPYLFSFFVATLAANIPVALPGGLGVREITMTKLAPYFGMDLNLAVYLTTTFFIIGSICALSGLYFVYNSKEFDPLPKAEEAKEFEEKADESIAPG